MIENELKNKINLENANLKGYNIEKGKETSIKKANHIIHFYKDYNNNKFKPIVKETEPWITDDYEKSSFYLCDNEVEALQLIVGRSTVQIWHQILSDSKDKNKRKEELPNKGKPFLEYIWTNGIPVDQENQKNRLQIKEIQFGLKYFFLEVFWYENDIENSKSSKEKEGNYEKEIRKKNMKKLGGMVIKTKILEWNDINENVNGIIYACKALKHLNKRIVNDDGIYKVSWF